MELALRVQAVVQTFAELKTESGQYLFRDGADGMAKVHHDAIQHILRGCVSDPPGEPMYMEIGKDDFGRPTYVSIRGSSRLEVRATAEGFPGISRATCLNHLLLCNMRQPGSCWHYPAMHGQGAHLQLNEMLRGHHVGPELVHARAMLWALFWNITTQRKNKVPPCSHRLIRWWAC